MSGEQVERVVPEIYYSCDNPSLVEFHAVDQLLAMEEGGLHLDFILVIGNRAAAVFPSGSYLEYEIDQRSGELKDVEEQDQQLKRWIEIIRE